MASYFNVKFTEELPEDEDKDNEWEVECRITSHGSPASGPSWTSPGEPAEPPEWEISEVTLNGEAVDMNTLSDEKLSWLHEQTETYATDADFEDDFDPDYD